MSGLDVPTLLEDLHEAKEYAESIRQRSIDYARQLEEALALQNQIRNDLAGMARSRDKWRAKYEAFTQCEATLAKLLRAAVAEAISAGRENNVALEPDAPALSSAVAPGVPDTGQCPAMVHAEERVLGHYAERRCRNAGNPWCRIHARRSGGLSVTEPADLSKEHVDFGDTD